MLMDGGSRAGPGRDPQRRFLGALVLLIIIPRAEKHNPPAGPQGIRPFFSGQVERIFSDSGILILKGGTKC